MKRTLNIPDELWAQLEEYLKNHPEQNPSGVVQAPLKKSYGLETAQGCWNWREF